MLFSTSYKSNINVSLCFEGYIVDLESRWHGAGWSNNGNINIATGSTSAQGGRCAVGRGSLESCRFLCCSHQKGGL